MRLPSSRQSEIYCQADIWEFSESRLDHCMQMSTGWARLSLPFLPGRTTNDGGERRERNPWKFWFLSSSTSLLSGFCVLAAIYERCCETLAKLITVLGQVENFFAFCMTHARSLARHSELGRLTFFIFPEKYPKLDWLRFLRVFFSEIVVRFLQRAGKEFQRVSLWGKIKLQRKWKVQF